MTSAAQQDPASTWQSQAKAGLIEFLQATRQLRALHEALGMDLVMHTTLDELLAERGELFEKRSRLPSRQVHAQSRQCYWNAWLHKRQNTASNPAEGSTGQLTYCEGFVALEGVCLPVMHGWCIDEQGVVHDPSVEQDKGAIYVGLRFTEDLAAKAWVQLEPKHLIGILPNLPMIDIDLEVELEQGRVWAAKSLALPLPSPAALEGLKEAVATRIGAAPPKP